MRVWHSGNLEYLPDGRVVEPVITHEECVNCEGRWTDEYGSAHYCRKGCTYGNGDIARHRTVRKPEYDAAPLPASNSHGQMRLGV